MAETRVQRYYLTRINKENGEVSYITIDNFDQLPRTRQTVDEANGYEDASVARGICTRLNQISVAIGGRYEYFDTRRDENTIPNTNGLSEEALKWLNPVEEETPVEEDAPVEDQPNGEATDEEITEDEVEGEPAQ